jgi:PIN domain nuclease of toxin-antitoxin system
VKLLLDTHAFLWLMAGDRRLSRPARRAVEDVEAELYLSAASVWEMAIKANLGRLQLPASVADYVQSKISGGFQILPVEWMHAAAVEALPAHHRDPFDRLLAAQSLAEKIPLVTADPAFKAHGVTVVW